MSINIKSLARPVAPTTSCCFLGREQIENGRHRRRRRRRRRRRHGRRRQISDYLLEELKVQLVGPQPRFARSGE